jgi:predicted RNase H-like HicB family nuclease
MARRREEAVGVSDVHYACTFRPEPEGGYTVRCSAFPEIVTCGPTLEAAREAAREAIELCVEVYQQEGRL